ncbi:MAG TPA: hypothetical protein VEA41_21270, partial [Salinarimonas sp.]|nr:hypothetical protein [Salinarimonas sp.]
MTKRGRGPRKGEDKHSQRRLRVALEKQLKALEMKAAGASYDAIAAACGYADKGGAYKAVSAGLKATLKLPADEVRFLEIER